jgi:3-oxoadipate enol-lactonase
MTITVNGVELFCEEVGSGTPLLCLSAYPLDGTMWREQRALGDVARLLLPDYRGIGRSGAIQGTVTMEELAADMVALLDALSIDQAVVMGDSMGCYVAFALYAAAPERVKALILADTRAEGDTPEQAQRRQKTVEGLRTAGTVVLESRVDDLFAQTTRRERPELVDCWKSYIRGLDAEGLAGLQAGMALRADRTGLLACLALPALVLCGEEDTVSPPEGMERMAARIPGARFHLLPRAGHLSPLEQPALFNARVREFLAGLAQ